MGLVERLVEEGRRVGRHWRVDLGGRPMVVRALRWPVDGAESIWEQPFSMRLVCVDGLESFGEFHRLGDEERRLLGLSPGRRILGLRPFVKGRSLSERIDGGRVSRLRWLARLAKVLRGIHAQGAAHGALHPENVIVDSEDGIYLVDPSPRGLGLAAVSEEADTTGASFRAPEMGDDRCGEKSDVFALGALCCWMVHGSPGGGEVGDELQRYGPADVPESLPAPLADVVRRSLGNHAELRPSAGQFEEALRRCGVATRPAFVSLPPSLYRSLERSGVEALDDGATCLVVEGKQKTGRSFALERIYQRLQLAGKRAVLCTAREVRGPNPGQEADVEADGDPWNGLRALLAALGAEVLGSKREIRGEYRHILNTWLRRLDEGLPDGETIILWDDFDNTRPDIRTFWSYLLKKMESDDGAFCSDLRLIAVTGSQEHLVEEEERLTVVGPSKRTWDGWRSRTKWVEVRQLSDEKWRRIATRLAARPAALFEAVNASTGVSSTPTFATSGAVREGTADVSVLFAGDWRRHLAELVSLGAYVEAIDTCEALAEVLQRSGRDELLAILEIWMETLRYHGATPRRVDALERALERALESAGRDEALRGALSLIQARLYALTGRAAKGLEALAGAQDLSAEQELVASRWRAELYLMAGDEEGAQEAIQQGLELVAKSDGEYVYRVRPLQILARGLAARSGDRQALDVLRRFAATLGDDPEDLRAKARCHALCAKGWERCVEFEEAVDAYLRAIEVLRTGGMVSELPGMYLEVGILFRRLGRLGLAREYCARGRKLVDETTWPATRGRLLAEEAKLALTLGGDDDARRLIDRAGDELEAGAGAAMAAAYFEVAADLASREGRSDDAVAYCEEVWTMEGASPRQRAQVCLKAATVRLASGDAESVREWLDRAQRHIEEEELSKLEHHCGLLRARLWWENGDLLERMTGTDRFRRHLEAAADDGEHLLVLEQTGHLWEPIVGEDKPALEEELAQRFHRAKEMVTRGLEAEQRERFEGRLPDIPLPYSEEARHVDEEAVALVDELRRDVARLTRVNEELEERLGERERAVTVLQTRLQKLEDELDAARNGGERTGRGRPPKATRDDVITALQDADGDVDAAADHLGVSKRTLYRYFNRYDIEVGEL